MDKIKKLLTIIIALAFILSLAFISAPSVTDISDLPVLDTQKSINPWGNEKMIISPITADLVDKADFMMAETTDYPLISISKQNMWFTSDTIATYKIISSTDQSLIDFETQGKATLYQDGQLFEDATFNDVLGQKTNVNFQYYIKIVEPYQVDVNDYKDVCSEVYSKENATTSNVCKPELVGSHKEDRENVYWKEYNFEVLPAGDYEWKITGKKGVIQTVDMIPVAQGKDFSEWAWYNSSWTYKQDINVTNSLGNTYANFSMKLNVTYNAHMMANFSDLRFTDSAGTTELPFWIDNVNTRNSASAIVYVKINPLNAGVNAISMYYGNAQANSKSNMTAAFIVGDDFNSGSLNSLWTNLGGTHGKSVTAQGWLNISYTSSSSNAATFYNRSMDEYENYTVFAELRLKGNTDRFGIGLRGDNNMQNIVSNEIVDSGNSLNFRLWTDAVGTTASSSVSGGAFTYAEGQWVNQTAYAIGSTFAMTADSTNSNPNASSVGYFYAGKGGYIGFIEALNAGSEDNVNYVYAVPKLSTDPTSAFSGEQTAASTVTINSPADNSATNNPTVTYSATYTGFTNIDNMSLYDNSTGTYKYNYTRWVSNLIKDFAGTNTGIPTNVTLNASSNTQGYANFNGQSNVALGSSYNVLNLSSDYTFSTWVYLTSSNLSTGDGQILVLQNSSGNNLYSALAVRDISNVAQIKFRFASNSTCDITVTSLGSSKLNSWLHLVGVYNKTTDLLYINGNLSNTANIPSSCQSLFTKSIYSSIKGSIGSSFSAVQLINGSIDEVKIWNRSLSSSEVLSDYNSYSLTGIGGSPIRNQNPDTNGLVAFYSFDQALVPNALSATATLQNTYNDGTYKYGVQACDTLGACAFSSNQTITVDTLSPSITITYPLAQTYSVNVSTLNYTIAHNGTLDKCWYSRNATTNVTIACGTNATNVLSLEGSNTWTVWANDTANNVGSASVIFSRDTIAPYINITSPLNTSYTTTNLTLIFTSNDTLDSAFYSLNGNPNLTLLKTFSTCYQETANQSTIGDGNCGIDYSGNYSYQGDWFSGGGYEITNLFDGNWGSYDFGTSANFSVNYIKPLNAYSAILQYETVPYDINQTSNIPIPQQCFNQNGIQLKFIATTPELHNRTISLNCYNGTTFYEFKFIKDNAPAAFGIYEEAMIWNVSTYENNYISGQQGSNNLKVYGNDTAGNLNMTQVNFFVDSLFPNITISYPTNNTKAFTINQTLDLNFSIVDLSIDKCWYQYSNAQSQDRTVNQSYLIPNALNISSINISYVTHLPQNVVYNIPKSCTSNNLLKLNRISYTQFGNTINDFTCDNSTTNVTIGSVTWGNINPKTLNDISLNYDVNCNKNSSFVYKDNMNSITLFANDSFGNIASQTSTWIPAALINSVTYNNLATELGTEAFSINVSFFSGYSGSYGYLYYNTVPYLSSISSDGTNTIFTTSIEIPTINASVNNSFYYYIIYTDGTNIFNLTSLSYNQSVGQVFLAYCNATYNVPAINFSLKEEATFLPIAGSLSATLNYWSNSSSGILFKNTLFANLTDNLTNYAFCIYPAYSYFKVSGTVQYSKVGYDQRTYWFNNANINNITQNINLYLASTNSTDIMTFKVIDERDNNIAGAYVYLQRWDIGTNNFYTVAVSQTDNNGQAVVNMRLNDAYYRQVVVYNGQTYLTTVPAIETTTSKILRIYLSVVNPYQYFGALSYNLSYNNDTKFITLTYTDTSGSVSQGCLAIYENSIYNTTLLATPQCINTASGSLSYLANENRTYVAQAYATLISNYSSVTTVLDTLTVNANGNPAWRIVGTAGRVVTVLVIGTAAMFGVAAGSIPLGLFLIVAAAIGCAKIGFINFTEMFIWSIVSIIILLILTTIRRR